ncbi:crotonobetainyl-CoA:carnitine CoA-transferase CaiB-like acyl-CoA transferase [Bradyrhizobium sp. cir1]|uniref:CaiB/BaiF CoA-transferase family protein n=1 Tax=Bradyrhizobium sp. cir1 TaxID=1445730 RepID=UPI001606D18E|nr:CoA transferase [Bradyrhizobium sp. cir1]MBB4375088.1 crotonobetainyl-CoA:carnitine CoA-transferase CaiB-like acyl-CoA transferase [Bradyrhizobium sp. cir1]
MQFESQRALAGMTVTEIGGGAASAYCGRLLADAGASVTAVRMIGDARAIVRERTNRELAISAYLSADKSVPDQPLKLESIQRLCRAADVTLVGEDSSFCALDVSPKRATIDLTWFGRKGPYKTWRGSDLVVEALTAMPHRVGPVEGPPLHAGDRHATMIGGVTAYIAAMAAMLAKPTQVTRRFELSILEANLVLSEMDIHYAEGGASLERHGINRFSPHGPVGIYPCKGGWVGITATTPDQWKSLCAALQMEKEGADEKLATRELRFERLDEVEQAMIRALGAGTAEQWAEVGRRHRVPIVVVPDAAGILSHPIFAARESLAVLSARSGQFKVPRTPFGLSKTPTSKRLNAADGEQFAHPGPYASSPQGEAAENDLPLSGLTVVDFTMGWAGPLASRLLADLGAEVLKIEAGRYPDWWRGVNWTPEYIAAKQYEEAKHYCALNRGKRGISLDLTNAAGKKLALALVAKADAVIDNQAAGVMDRLGLGYGDLVTVNPNIVMTSMSAFGTGNAWSDTRAYGSTLEQGSGLVHFMGNPGTPPTMAHLAYGDPVGGLYGCASLLTALAYKRHTGEGQYVNVSMVESMLQFTTPALLQYQADPAAPLRWGNRHPLFAPHAIYQCAGEDRWLAMAIDSTEMFASLARVIGRSEWIGDAAFDSAESRRRRHDQIDAAISAWTTKQEPHQAAAILQKAGIAAAPVLHTEEIVQNPHLIEAGFFIDLVREFSGPQRQAGVAIMQDGKRLGAHAPAPRLGEHSWPILERHVGIERAAYEALVNDGVITFAPTSLRRSSSLADTRTAKTT